ncbi:MAG: PAS domain-containing protein [Rhodospirillaceae bacterium]|nr:MAG: PAS domain-containing protein [Rhodospirillaceae bacterium]
MVEVAVYMVDAEGRILSCTAGARDLQGYAATEIVGQSFDRLFSDEDRAAQVPAALLAAEKQGRSRQTGWLLRKDGGHFCANLEIHALHDAGGSVLGFAVTVQHAGDLQLPENGMAAASAQGLVHDINNMLAVISASIDLISRYPDDLERVQRMAGNIKQALARAESLAKRFSSDAAGQHGEADAVTHADPLADLTLDDLAAGLVSVMQADKGRKKKPATLE